MVLQAPHPLMCSSLWHTPAPHHVGNGRPSKRRHLLVVHDVYSMGRSARQYVVFVMKTQRPLRACRVHHPIFGLYCVELARPGLHSLSYIRPQCGISTAILRRNTGSVRTPPRKVVVHVEDCPWHARKAERFARLTHLSERVWTWKRTFVQIHI